jgi:hypothetical protein
MKPKHDPAAIRLLESIGFRIEEEEMKYAMNQPINAGVYIGIFATRAAEPVNLRPHHFTPAFRDVYVGECVGGYYATSHITGELRLFRQHRKNTDKAAKVYSVFGYGKTELEAVRAFVDNLTASPIRYNVR